MRLSDQATQRLIPLAAMGHQQVFMIGMKDDNRSASERTADEKLPPVVAKYPLNEVIP